MEELWLDVGEEEVWVTGGGEELVVGILGRLGGNESVSLTSSSNGSGRGEKERERGRQFNENESCFICFGGFRMAQHTVWLAVGKLVVVTAGCASRQTVLIPGDSVNYVVFDWELIHSLLTNLNDCVLTNCYLGNPS